MDTEQLRYPVGKFKIPDDYSSVLLNEWIEDIESFPEKLRKLTEDLDTEDMNRRYRPEGWSIKQVVHHCADSHLNSQMRFKLALTQDNPTICPYMEDRWAELPDSQTDDISDSLMILTGLHNKWAYLLKSLTREQLQRTYMHPEHGREFTLEESIGTYAWHCRHHLAHIRQAIECGERYTQR